MARDEYLRQLIGELAGFGAPAFRVTPFPDGGRTAPDAPAESAGSGTGGLSAEALVPPMRELTGGIQELTGNVKALQEATRASTEAVTSSARAWESGWSLIRAVGFGAGTTGGSGLGGLLGVSPMLSGLRSLFGGRGADAPGGVGRTAEMTQAPAAADRQGWSYGERGEVRVRPEHTIHVHVQTMDSQSFADQSGKIAEAVRTAMLQSGALSDVWGDL